MQSLKEENEKLKQDQRRMQQEYELMQRRLMDLEKNSKYSPRQESQGTEIVPGHNNHVTFMSREYLNAIGKNSSASM